MVIVIARFQARPDSLEAFVALLRDVQSASRADDGCLHYGYYREIDDDLRFTAVEEWHDMDALAAHLRTPHVARLIAALPKHSAGELDLAAHTVAESGRLPL